MNLYYYSTTTMKAWYPIRSATEKAAKRIASTRAKGREETVYLKMYVDLQGLVDIGKKNPGGKWKS